MRILHVIASLDPSYGGPAVVVKGLCEALKRAGLSVEIFSDRDYRPLVRRYFWSPFLKEKMQKILRNFDLVHVHGLFNGLASAACRAARSTNVPYVLEPFGTLSPYCLKKSTWKKRWVLLMGEKKNVECASAVLFTSDGERERAAINFFLPHSFVAGNGLDWAEFSRLPDKGPFRKRWGIGPQEKMLLFVGRLQPIKGLGVFLPAFLEWRRSKTEEGWRMVVVGPDEKGYRSRLEKMVAPTDRGGIIFTGPLYGKDRLAAYVDCDAAVLPSFHENFGLSAAEAMACQKPVLISEGVDLWPVVKERQLGEVTAFTREGMAMALDRFAERQKQWPEMGARASRWAHENCDWDKIAKVVVGEYQRILSIHSS